MQRFLSDGVEIAYEVAGEGEPILLIHGFASNMAVNWKGTNWVKTLTDAGRRVITYDNRGHGRSQKLYDIMSYSGKLMAEDARRLLQHLEISSVDVMGYSMGARITAFLAFGNPALVRSAIFGGLGENMILGTGDPEPIAKALEAATLDDVTTKRGRMFRVFAERTGSDLRALALCMRAPKPKVSVQMIKLLPMPVLVVAGEKDTVSGSAETLAELIPNGKALTLPGKDHMNAVGDRLYKAEVLRFLQERP